MIQSLTSFARSFALPLWRWYLGGFIFLILTNYIAVEIPVLVKNVINQFHTSSDRTALTNTTILIVLLGFSQIVIRTLSRVFIFWPGRVIEQRTKTYLFRKLLTTKYENLINIGVGEIVSRLSNDINHIRVFFAFGLLQLLNMFFVVFFSLSKMHSIHQNLTYFVIIPLFGLIIGGKYVMPRLAYFAKRNQEATGELTKKTTESFVNIHTLQLHSAINAFSTKIDEQNKKIFDSTMGSVKIRTLFFPLFQTLTLFSQGIVLMVGGYAAANGTITLGDIVAFNIYLVYIAFPITSIGIVLSIFQRTKVALKRLHHLESLDTEENLESDIKINSSRQNNNIPLIEIKNLIYSYSNQKSPFKLIINSFVLKKGQSVAIFGSVGTGKSSLLNLLSLIYRPEENTIFFNGREITKYAPQYLRKKILYVPQGAHLFSDSIENNLKFGLDREVSIEEVENSLKAAQIYDEIQEFENGIHTEIGEKGIRLSGGQKQRIALARAFLKKPDIFMFDDSLSALDNLTEKKVLQFIKNLNKSYFIVSHREEVLKSVDHILHISPNEPAELKSYDQIKESIVDA